MAATQVVPRPRHHVADIGGLAALRVGKQALGGVGVLAVELRGQALGWRLVSSGARSGRQ